MAITKKIWNDVLNSIQRSTISKLYWKDDARKQIICSGIFRHNFDWTQGRQKEKVGLWMKEMLSKGSMKSDGTIYIGNWIIYQDGTVKKEKTES